MTSRRTHGLTRQTSTKEFSVGAIHVHEFMSLDGVIDAPTWTFDYGYDPKMGEAIAASMDGCTGILLGRTTYEMFEPAWSTRTVDDDPGAPFFNDTMKYVVSGSLTTATWRNSEIIGPYDPAAIRALKDRIDGDLYVSGSATLVRALLADGLVGEPAALPDPSRRVNLRHDGRQLEDAVPPAVRRWATSRSRAPAPRARSPAPAAGT